MPSPSSKDEVKQDEKQQEQSKATRQNLLQYMCFATPNSRLWTLDKGTKTAKMSTSNVLCVSSRYKNFYSSVPTVSAVV